MERLQRQVEQLMVNNSNLAKAVEQLVEANVNLYEQVDRFYNVRLHTEWFKELMRRHREVMAQADLRNDDELLAIIEARIEGDNIPLPPDFGVKEVAELVGVTQGRVIELYKKKTIYHSLDKYLDYLRLMRALKMLKEHPGYSVEAVAMDAGFNSVRTMQRKIDEAIGLTPGQFRLMTNSDL